MDMQDKEFDELFRSQLDGFETEPSASVWQGIAGGLDAAKRRKSLLPWLSIAAGIVVLIGIGILFMTGKTNNNPHTPVKNRIAGVKQPAVQSHQVAPQPVQSVPAVHTPVKVIESYAVAAVQPKKVASPVQLKKPDTVSMQPSPLKGDDRQQMAMAPQKPALVNKPVVPGPDVQLAVKTMPDQPSTAAPDKLIAQNIPNVNKDVAAVKQRRRIHNFGDLVNLVVDKLDNRKDKVIQIADDEDGDAHITGVNLGVLKIKKGE